jgi:NADPH-dependent methylglyoxal reductase
MASILLTGATGMLGAVILEQLIRDGHKVNAVVRSLAKSQDAISQTYPSAVKSGQLTFTEIPDMTVPGSFDNAVQNTSEFIHAATPLGDDNFLETVIKPASQITFNVLSRAAKSKTVRRVIITGSIVATFKVPDELFSGRTISEKEFNNSSLEESTSALRKAYSYSKVTSEKEAWAWMKKNKPNFDLIYLLAPSITGRSIQPGFKATKGHLGGIPSFYRGIFDQQKPGFLSPYYM